MSGLPRNSRPLSRSVWAADQLPSPRAVAARRASIRACFLVGLLFAIGASAATPFRPVYGDPLREPWRWRTYPELSGLGAQCIAQAKDGTLWFGTNENLWSYDGFRWRRHATPDIHSGGVNHIAAAPDGSIVAGGRWGLIRRKGDEWQLLFPKAGQRFADVRKIAFDREGVLWAATSWGLLRISADLSQRTLYTTPETAQSSAPQLQSQNLQVRLFPDSIAARPAHRGARTDLADLVIDRRGRIWCSTERGEVLRFDPQAGADAWRLFTEADGLKPGRHPSLLLTREDHIWLMFTLESPFISVCNGERWTTVSLVEARLPTDLSSPIQTRDGTIWLSSRYRLLSFRDGVWNTHERPEIPIPTATNFLLEAADGALWIAGPSTEIQRVDYATGRWTTLQDLMFQWESADGTAWFLHRSGRIVSQSGERWTAYGVEDGLPEAPVALVGTPRNEIWVAGSHHGDASIARFDGQRWTRFDQPEFAWGIDWRGVTATSDGSLWFCATVDSKAPARHRAGILQFRDGQWIHHHQPGRAPSYGNDSNPATLLPPTMRPEPVGKFQALAEGRPGEVWTGRNLLARFDGQKWERMQPPPGMQFGLIETLFSSREHELWLGSRQFGAFRFDGKQWQSFQQKDGLVANGIRHFAQTDDGSIWAATDHDISRFDGRAWQANCLPDRVTLPHEGGSLRAGRDGRLWINHFPSNWMWRAWANAVSLGERADEFWTVCHRAAGSPPDTVLTLAPTRIEHSGTLSVAWHGVAPWRRLEEAQLRYSFRLDGGEWSDYQIESSHAFFQLATGRHRLEVRARDRDFNVDPTPAVLEFQVLPPVWQQGWFLSLIGIGLVALSVQTWRLLRESARLRRANRDLAAEINEHKHAELARAASEARFRELAENIEDVFWSIDAATGRPLYINPAYERVWGRSCASLYAQPDSRFDAIHPDNRAAVREAEPAQRTGTYNVVYRVVRPDGTTRWVHDRAFPVRDEQGRVLRIVGVARDITERWQAQEELRTQEEYFRRLIENGSDLITVVGLDAVIRYQSPSVIRILGRSPDATRGTGVTTNIHPEDIDAVRQSLQRAAGADEPVSAEFRVRAENGKWVMLHSLGRRMLGPNGEHLVVVNSRDVTAMHELEERFRHAQKMEAIGRLAGGVAHDFNNLLTVIKGNTSLLQLDDAIVGEARGLLRDIMDAVDRAVGLTRQLLTFSRQEHAHLADLDLNQIVADLGKMLRRVIGDDISLEIAAAPTPLWIRADRGMMEQVLMNLVVNARDAIPHGGKITLRLLGDLGFDRPPECTSAMARIVVTDTGIGIAPEHLPRIFEPFFTTKEVGRGTGLGLATVHGIVEQHHGKVTVTSVVGRGTTFTIWLPLVPNPTRPPDTGTATFAPLPRARAGDTVLLVENETAVANLARRVLTDLGYTVLLATNGCEAETALRHATTPVGLLLADIVLPGGFDGIALAQRLQSLRPGLRVLFTSGRNRGHADWGASLSHDAPFLPKPFDAVMLATAVRAAFDAPPHRIE